MRSNLEESAELDEEDRQLIMQLSPILSRQLEEARQEGMQQGQRFFVENMLKVRFGSLDEQLSAVIAVLK